MYMIYKKFLYMGVHFEVTRLLSVCKPHFAYVFKVTIVWLQCFKFGYIGYRKKVNYD